VVNPTPRILNPYEKDRYPINRRLAGPKNQSERFGERKNLLVLLGIEVRIVQPID
jgi:hypothetical protein